MCGHMHAHPFMKAGMFLIDDPPPTKLSQQLHKVAMKGFVRRSITVANHHMWSDPSLLSLPQRQQPKPHLHTQALTELPASKPPLQPPAGTHHHCTRCFAPKQHSPPLQSPAKPHCFSPKQHPPPLQPPAVLTASHRGKANHLLAHRFAQRQSKLPTC